MCEVGEFRNNVTVTAGRLLRLSCPLASSPACLLATTRYLEVPGVQMQVFFTAACPNQGPVVLGARQGPAKNCC